MHVVCYAVNLVSHISFSTISLVLLHHITNITALILHTTQDKPIKTPRQSIKTDTFMLSFRTSLIPNIGFKSSLQLSVETPNQNNSDVQSEERFTSSLANENSKWKQVHCLKRGKTPMTRSWLILVCILLVGRRARVFLDQSQQKVFSKTKTISDYFWHSWKLLYTRKNTLTLMNAWIFFTECNIQINHRL